MPLEDSTCIVTGASQGIGKATALGLARTGAEVVLVSRDPARAQEAVREITAASGNPRVVPELADLSLPASVRELAQRLLDRPGRIGVLVNNAAVAFPQRRETAEGVEMQWAVNHLAPFLLTNLLLPRLLQDAPARIVNVSSGAHRRGTIDFEDLEGKVGYTGSRAYDQSKLANVLFTYELARRLEGTGVTANCLHPGVVPTNINGYLRRGPRGSGGGPSLPRRAVQAVRWRLRRLLGKAPRIQTAEEASRTSVYLATSPEVRDVSGRYFNACREERSSPESYDEAVAARLWAVSEELLGFTAPPIT